jgi:hypothetical protein
MMLASTLRNYQKHRDSAITKPNRAVQFAEVVVESTHQSSKKDLKICELVIKLRRRRKDSFERLQNVKQNLQTSRSLLQNSSWLPKHENSPVDQALRETGAPMTGPPGPAGTPFATSIYSGVLGGSTVLVSGSISPVYIFADSSSNACCSSITCSCSGVILSMPTNLHKNELQPITIQAPRYYTQNQYSLHIETHPK